MKYDPPPLLKISNLALFLGVPIPQEQEFKGHSEMLQKWGGEKVTFPKQKSSHPQKQQSGFYSCRKHFLNFNSPQYSVAQFKKKSQNSRTLITGGMTSVDEGYHNW